MKGLGLGWRAQEAGDAMSLENPALTLPVLVAPVQGAFLGRRLLSGWLFKVVLWKSPGTKRLSRAQQAGETCS